MSTVASTVIMLLTIAVSLSLASLAFGQGTSTHRLVKADLNSLNRSGADRYTLLTKDGRSSPPRSTPPTYELYTICK